MGRGLPLALLAAMACGSSSNPTAAGPPAPASRPEADIRVALGDCSAVDVAWVSGPRPRWFDPDDPRGVWVEPVRGARRRPARRREPGIGLDPTATEDVRELGGQLGHDTDDAAYRPGEKSPLRDIERDLVACFRRQTRPYGVMLVELHFDADGAVTGATARGSGSSDVDACAAAEAERLRLARPGPVALTCSVALGTMPAKEAPGFDMTTDAVRWNGRLDVDPLVAFQAHVAAAAAPGSVAIRGPVFIRAVDATPMMAVNQLTVAVHSAGEEVVLAARTDSGWRSLRPIELPVVPVPVGTGGSWNPAPLGAGSPDAEPVAMLSLMVSADAVWIGIAGLGDSRRIAGHDWDAVARTLAEIKAGPAFAGRDDIEIAAEADARYGDLLAAIARAEAAGFARWQVMLPGELSTRFLL